MKKLIYILIIALMLFNCNSPKEIFKIDCYGISKRAENKFLKHLDASDSRFSVLIFTEHFENDNIMIKNDSIIFNNTMVSHRSYGVAKQIKVENKYNVIITDGEYKFIIKRECLNSYKYIYIEKDPFSTKAKYKIKYSNILCGFY